MKNLFFVLVVCSFALASGCATKSSSCCPATQAAHSKPMVVDAACGQCLFGLKEKKGCDLAVRLDGKSYFVDGVSMKQLGDAHAADGMCNKIRKAKVTGEVENGRFVASSFEILPAKK